MTQTRHQQFQTLFPNEPTFRWNQIEEGLFSSANNWNEITTIPSAIRESLSQIPWMSVELVQIQVSKNGDTHKALLKVEDDKDIETVLMKNPRGAWTICVSSQVGCAMRCGFCATGKMGLTRNLTTDEIVDQYRFWTDYLHSYNLQPNTSVFPRISNIVFMGMGEPLANYEEVKRSLNTLLTHTDLGKTRITVSRGRAPRLEQTSQIKNGRSTFAVAHSATLRHATNCSNVLIPPKTEDWGSAPRSLGTAITSRLNMDAKERERHTSACKSSPP